MSLADSSYETAYQQLINNSAQVREAVQFQAMADRSPQVQKALQLQASADTYVQQSDSTSFGQEEQSIPSTSRAKDYQGDRTGLPDALKSGVEQLSGLSMDDVRVHYNSSRPRQLEAFAYAQGTNIHVAPGQERHLPHEAWHVVQ